MKPNFKNIDIYAGFQPQNGMEWQKENGITADWKTPEHINVKPVYTKEDLEGMEHLNKGQGRIFGWHPERHPPQEDRRRQPLHGHLRLR